jgi:hypothetical protein
MSKTAQCHVQQLGPSTHRADWVLTASVEADPFNVPAGADSIAVTLDGDFGGDDAVEFRLTGDDGQNVLETAGKPIKSVAGGSWQLKAGQSLHTLIPELVVLRGEAKPVRLLCAVVASRRP